MNRQRSLFSSILILLLFLGSCINDDLSECPSGRYLHFETLNGKYSFRDVVETVDLYIYKGNSLVETKRYSRGEIQATGYKIYLNDRPNGTELRYVALVNQAEDCYHTTGSETLEGMLTGLVSSETDSLADLYHGTKDILFEHRSAGVADTIYLKKNTNKINLYVGFDGYELPQGSTLHSYIQGRNGQYDSENKPVENSRYTYHPYRWALGGEESRYDYDAHFTTLRLWIGADTDLSIEKQNTAVSPLRATEAQLLYRLNIVEELAKVVSSGGTYLYDTNEKLELEDEFDIILLLDGNFVVLELIINDWVVISNRVPL
ncbi:hypothetical protein M2463_002989 [Parabacteroides sp. PH5-13]|uniref:FimB/Mfa2 family fimbrial subunit n=1 Tax=unclassified Parabacteroides TaxID=2649774 RepID=UPI0024732FCE|nr:MULTISPECIES: FimB/Mfa2 family fimbrial subunit [unclassified Parabacteroides]MDH6306321.1 hypothetical protein [Parabacteroides sp. PH5-39]MDH6320957.1 hypothetical protein [Parabacteroides sp. PH5-13]MDH6324689.1 hypothetical protein [Parabacteroides sp. PH5-8]MDH6385876.1 hypothetical protein [Parabacteroides sp. PH5-17]MDH6395157.1 hypothetical protein [Parabacteroides sp. PFB2-22]